MTHCFQPSDKDCISHEGAHMHDVYVKSEQDISERLIAAEKFLNTQNVRFTTLRRTVYKLILESDKPLGAYDLIQELQASRIREHGKDAKMVAPPTIYRSLEFLLQYGFIHQINSINAYVPCCHPRDEHNAVFLLCNDCHRVQEFSGLPVQEVVNDVKQAAGFEVLNTVMELKGLCNHCNTKNASNSNASTMDK